MAVPLSPGMVAALDQCEAAYRDVDDAAAAGDPLAYAVAVMRAEHAWSLVVAASPRGRARRFGR